jgi:hypothetical protein
MPFPLQDTQRDQTAGEVMPLSPLGAGLTATQAELSLPDPHDFFNMRAPPLESAHRHGRQRQAVGGKGLGAALTTNTFRPPGS